MIHSKEPYKAKMKLRNKSKTFLKKCTLFWLKIQHPGASRGLIGAYGAEDEIRTRDPRLGKAMLYH
jgi:hypothetical protein